MKQNNSLMMKILPWLLIVFGIFTLNKFQGLLSGVCVVIGIMMLIERVWPETWGPEQKKIKE